ncbi:MAG: hypothetical protein U0075_21780 [Thermomicrobiales bacterium]
MLDPVLQGEICGEAGQVCQSDGSCTCDATSCPACTTCGGDGACAGCANCCDGSGVCQDGVTNQACGSSGTCDVCSGQEICQDQQCVCIPITQCPVELACGTISDGCGGQLTCGECANPTPVCTQHVCVPCEQSAQCASREICDGGSCAACDVCADGCTFTSVQAAIEATSPQLTRIRICPGAYAENARSDAAIIIDHDDLTLIGAGDGGDPNTSTILRPSASDQAVIRVDQADTIRLEGLRVTGGFGDGGSGVLLFTARVTLARCTIVGNEAVGSGGGVSALNNSVLDIFDTMIIDNSSTSPGGGIQAEFSIVTLDMNSRVNFNGAPGAGGIYAMLSSITLPSVDNVTNNRQIDCAGVAFEGPGAVCAE